MIRTTSGYLGAEFQESMVISNFVLFSLTMC
jgi:hypothetical protein